jgi:hypothetical protein
MLLNLIVSLERNSISVKNHFLSRFIVNQFISIDHSANLHYTCAVYLHTNKVPLAGLILNYYCAHPSLIHNNSFWKSLIDREDFFLYPSAFA